MSVGFYRIVTALTIKHLEWCACSSELCDGGEMVGGEFTHGDDQFG